jgi:MoaA/NifB/PqqE/SkfB family radical SAM enzyme
MTSLPNSACVSTQDLSFLWLEITEKCNLECLHCYADSSPRQDLFGLVDTETWLAVLRESATLGCTQVQFIGGEPTLHPDLSRMIRFASASGYSLIEVFTNATLFDEVLIEEFIEHGVAIATSFYSDDPETHDQITKHRGSFARTVSNIKRFVCAGLQVRAGIIEMPQNTGHAQRAKRLLGELGVSDVNIDLQRGVGRGEHHLHSLDPFSELCGQCWKGKLCVTSLGRVYPCVFSRFADLGDVRRGISTILQEAPLFKFRTALSQHQDKRYRQHEGFISEPPPVATPGLHMHVCGPDLCDPSSSNCGPGTFKCMPSQGPCSPDSRCAPSTGPCAPDTRCDPSTRPCAPDIH